MHNSTLFIKPAISGNLENQLLDCHQQIDSVIGKTDSEAVMFVYFIKADNNKDYYETLVKTETLHKTKYQAPCSVIAQPPINGYLVYIEVHICSKSLKPEFKKYKEYPYCIFYEKGSKYLYAAGLQSKQPETDILNQSEVSFDLMEGILHAEGMDFSNILRQWNYIESIVIDECGSQHYQVFNDVRSSFYNKSEFINGYPAATGIGIKAGGIVIDFIASDEKNVWPVKNPAQTDAHQYSKELLGENFLAKSVKKSTPKFERAKVISLNGDLFIYVSGTASILGQKSQAINDAYRQTLITLENIENLINKQNLLNHSVPNKETRIEPVILRIYVKNKEDVPLVNKALETKIKSNTKVIYAIADVCRPELLVEIEGIYRF